MSGSQGSVAAPENEFDSVGERASELGVDHVPALNRRWVNVSAGGHVSGVVWGSGPEVVLVHRSEPAQPVGKGVGARTLDDVALHLALSAVVLDLPGSGRSSGPATRPRRAGPLLGEAIASFAPRTRLVAGIGEGGLAALAAVGGRSSLPGPHDAALVLVDVLPGLGEEPDDRVAWEQLAGVARVEVVRSSDSPLTTEQLERFGSLAGATVTELDVLGAAWETGGAAALATALRAAAERAGVGR